MIGARLPENFARHPPCLRLGLAPGEPCLFIWPYQATLPRSPSRSHVHFPSEHKDRPRSVRRDHATLPESAPPSDSPDHQPIVRNQWQERPCENSPLTAHSAEGERVFRRPDTESLAQPPGIRPWSPPPSEVRVHSPWWAVGQYRAGATGRRLGEEALAGSSSRLPARFPGGQAGRSPKGCSAGDSD